MYKKAIILVCVAVVASLFWFWVKPWVDSPTRFSDVGIWLKPLISLAVLSSLVGLAFSLFRNSGLRILISALAGLPLFFVFGFNPFYAGAFALMLLLHLYAASNIQAEANERTKVKIRLVLQRGLQMIIMPILIMISFAFFLSPNLQATAKSKQLPPTIKQVIESTVNSFLGEQIKSLPPQERQQAKSQIVNQVLEQMTALARPYFKFLPPILAFGLFLVLESLSFVFVWLSVLFGWLIFWSLKKTEIVKITVVATEAERIDFN